MVKSVFIALTLALAIPAAQAAGGFDGKWSGEANGSQASSAAVSNACVAKLEATVADNLLKGTFAFPRTTVPWVSKIGDDGSINSTIGTMTITGKFDGAVFTGSMTIKNGYCNPYRLSMKRA